MGVPQLDLGDLLDWHGDDNIAYSFSCAMISSFEPFFDDLDDNVEVEERLRKAGVITCEDAEAETCELTIYFVGRIEAIQFITRLNDYFMKKAELMQRAREF